MKRFLKTGAMIIIVTIFVFSANKSFAQIPTVQDCLGAIPICGPTFSEANAYQETGNYLDEIDNGISCLGTGEKNDVWYIFTVAAGGELNFSITPNDLSDDYDWAVYNVTTNLCGDIFDTPGMEVSCNYSGASGITGPNGLSGSQNEVTVSVAQNDIYVINVSQYSSSLSGYTIDFGASTADIFDNVTPNILHAASTEYCDSSVVSIHFNENIQCGSVDALDFRVFGPGNPIVTLVSSPTCDITGNAGYGIDFKLHLDRPLQLGNYGIVVFPHTGSSVIDNCGNQCNGGYPEQIFFNTVPEGGMSIELEPVHISCFGADDGIINTNVANHTSLITGGDLIYSFEGAAQDFAGIYTGLTAGTYTVDVQTIGGCIGDASIEIIEPPQAFSDAGNSKVICGLPEHLLEGNMPEVGLGTWTTDAPQFNFADANNGTSFLTSIPYGEYTYTWTVDNGVCGTFTDDILITRYPSNNYTGADLSLCQPTDFQLNGQDAFPGTGFWTSSEPGVTFDNASSYNSLVNNLPYTDITFTWTMDVKECGILSDDFTLRNYEMPIFTNAGTDDDFCEPDGQLNADIPIVGTGVWLSTSGTSILTPSSNTTFIENLDPGLNDFVWSVSNGICPAVSDIITIQRLSASTANAGNDFAVCNSDTIMFGNFPQNGTGLWIHAGTSTLLNNTIFNSAISNLEEGENEFVWEIKNQFCPASTDTVIITNYLEPSLADAGGNDRICGNSVLLTANNPAIGTGFWTTTGGASILEATNNNTIASNLSAGVNIFTWAVTSGVCVPQEDIALILSDDDVGTAFAGIDKITCEENIILLANSPLAGTGQWTAMSGGATIVDPNNPFTSVTSLAFGLNTFRWKFTNGACESEDIVNITRNPAIPDANAGSDIAMCDPTFTLNANNPGAATGFWTTISNAIIDNSASNVTTTSNLAYGENTFVWNITDGLCQPKSDTIVVTLDQNPTFTLAGADQVICNPIASLSASTPAFGTGIWISQGNAIVANSAVENSIAVNLEVGENIFLWSVSNGTCPPATDEIVVIRDAIDAPTDAGADINLCEDGNVTLNANNPVSGEGVWTTASGAVISNNSLHNTTASNLSLGVNTLTWTTQYGVCPQNSDDIDILVEAMPSIADAGSDQVICANSFNLSANTPLVGNGTWTTTGGSSVVNPVVASTFVGNLDLGENVLTWTISGVVCPPSISEVIIFQDSHLLVDAGADVTVCGGNATLLATQPILGSGVWSSSNSVVFAQNTLNTTNIANLEYGANILTWQVSGGACPPVDSQVTITRELEPSISEAGTDFHVCEDSVILSATTPTVGLGNWIHNGVSTSSNSSLFNATYSNIVNGENVFYWEISNGVCPPSIDSVSIVRDQYPVASATDDLAVCADSSFIGANQPTIGTGYWSTSGIGQIDDINNLNPFVRLMGAGVNTFYWNVDNGVCATAIDSLTVTAFDDNYAPVPNKDDLPDLTAECSYTVSVVPLALDNCKGDITAYTNDNTEITEQGTHIITWIFEDGNGNSSYQKQNVIISDITLPEAVCPDYIEFNTDIVVGEDAFYQVKEQELDPVSFSDNCITDRVENDFTIENTLADAQLPEGITEITWTVFDGNLNKAQCTFQVRVFSEVSVPEAFSPNGDGKNDVLYISGLAALPLNSIVIFNRWGAKVFEEAPYTNLWDGKSTEGVSISGTDLPAGTYFYILKTGENDEFVKGFIHLER